MLSGTRKPKYNDCHDSTIQMKMRVLTPIDIVYLGKKNYVKGCILVGSLLAENKPRQLGERMVPCYPITNSPGYAWIMVIYTNHALVQLCQEITGYLTTQKQTVMRGSSKPKKRELLANLKKPVF